VIRRVFKTKLEILHSVQNDIYLFLDSLLHYSHSKIQFLISKTAPFCCDLHNREKRIYYREKPVFQDLITALWARLVLRPTFGKKISSNHQILYFALLSSSLQIFNNPTFFQLSGFTQKVFYTAHTASRILSESRIFSVNACQFILTRCIL